MLALAPGGAQGRLSFAGAGEAGGGYDSNVYYDATNAQVLYGSEIRAAPILHLLPALELRWEPGSVFFLNAAYRLQDHEWLDGQGGRAFFHQPSLELGLTLAGRLDVWGQGLFAFRRLTQGAENNTNRLGARAGVDWRYSEQGSAGLLGDIYHLDFPDFADTATSVSSRFAHLQARWHDRLAKILRPAATAGIEFRESAPDQRADQALLADGQLLLEPAPGLLLGPEAGLLLRFADRNARQFYFAGILEYTIFEGFDVWVQGRAEYGRSADPYEQFERFLMLGGIRGYFEMVHGGSEASAVSPPPVLADLRPRRDGGRVRFFCRAEPRSQVALTGEMNNWNPAAHPMREDPERPGVFLAELELAPGIYQYACQINGAVEKPPDAPAYAIDGFGGTNGVVEVRLDQPAAGD